MQVKTVSTGSILIFITIALSIFCIILLVFGLVFFMTDNNVLAFNINERYIRAAFEYSDNFNFKDGDDSDEDPRGDERKKLFLDTISYEIALMKNSEFAKYQSDVFNLATRKNFSSNEFKKHIEDKAEDNQDFIKCVLNGLGVRSESAYF